jgi:uncharacterized protein YidB (DUF937 family)
MGILDLVKGLGGGGGRAQQNDLVNAVVSMIGGQKGGLEGFVQQLAGKGLGDIVNSWVSTGQNLPISADQLKVGLGNTTVSQLASKTGMTSDELTSQLASLLPQVVDRLTPDGQIPKGDIAAQGMNLLKSLLK